MNSAINNTIQTYLENFMNTVAERFSIERDELDTLWKEVQKKKFTKTKKNKKNKSQSIPSAYILFSHDERPKIKEEDPTLSFVEIGRELGRRWKKASDEVKEHYNQQRELLRQQQATTTTTSDDEEDAASTTTTDEEIVPMNAVVEEEEVIVREEKEKPKKPKKTKPIDIPEDITDERQRDLWPEFATLTIAELREQCDRNNIKRNKNRNVMIQALVVHRIALEDGNTQADSDEDEEF